MLIKACFLIQPLEQEGVYQKSCISLCSKVFINHFYRMKASPECLNILTYWSKYLVDRLRRTLRRKVQTGIFYKQICRICHYILHQVAHIDCSAPSGKQHEPLNGVCVIQTWYVHLLGESSELICFFATLAKFWPSSGHKMTENGSFWPLSEKVFTQSNSNLVCTLIGWVFRNDLLWGNVGHIFAL